MHISNIPFYKSLSGRLFIALAFVALISVGGLGWADYQQERAALETQVIDQLTSIADLKKEQIVTWLYERQADARLLAVNKLNQDHLTEILSPDVSPDRRVEFTAFLSDNLIGLQQSRTGYNDIAFVDTQGTVVVSTEPNQVGQPVNHRVVFVETLASSKGTFTQDIHVDPDTGLTTMAFGHIIHAIDLKTGEEKPDVIGMVIITVNMDETIYPLIRAWPGMRETGETLLIRAEGDTTLFLNNLRFNDTAALNLRIPANSPHAKPAHLSSRSAEGVIQTSDYRGVPILAAYRHIPGVNWGFVAKKDINEAFAPVDALARRIGLIVIAVLSIAGLVSWAISRTLTRPLAELVEGTQAVAAGNLSTKIDSVRQDEIGTLADSFRVMVTSLEQRREQVKAANEATHRSAEELKIVSELLHSLNTTPNIAEAFSAIMTSLRTILDFETASLGLLDESGETLNIVVMDRPRIVPRQGLWIPIKDTAAAKDLLAGRPHLIPHLVTEINFSLERRLYEAGYRSRVSLPLRIEGKSIGLLSLVWLNTNGYDITRLSLLEQIADTIALAVERSRLFDETRQRGTELSTLHKLALAVNRSLEPSEVLQLAVDHTVHLLDAVGAGIFLIEDSGLLRIGATHKPSQVGTDAQRLAVANTVWEKFSKTDISFQSIELTQLPANKSYIDKYQRQGVKLFNLIRLAHAGEPLGMLVILWPRSDVTATETQLSQTIAQIIGPAIAHAQHYFLTYEQLQRTNRRLRLVNQMSRRLSAILDADQLLAQVNQLVQSGLGYDYVGVGIVEGDQIIIRTVSTKIHLDIPETRQKVGKQSLSNWVLSHSQALLISDVRQDDRYYPHPMFPDIRSELIVPICLANHPVGILLVSSDQVDAFNEDDQTLLRAIADQLALALQNAQSYGQMRKLAIKALQESEERLRNIYEAANDAIFLIDPENTRIIEANPKASRMLGYSQEELAGMSVNQIHPGEMELITQLWETTLCNGVGQSDQLTCLTKDGQKIPAEASFSQVQIRDEQYILAMVRDVTERRQLEARLRQSQKMEAIGQLAGGVAHDFNNLLTVITGYSDLLKQQISDDALRKDVEQIQKAGERAAALTRQLLTFSRKQVLQPRVLDLNVIVGDMEKMLHRLIGEDVELTTILEPHLGRVKADPGQIEQVVMNLSINARDAMPRGGNLTIETHNLNFSKSYVRQYMDIEPGPYVALTVSDTGIGMDAQTQARIFEPFFTTKDVEKGTGLGLATVYGIVTQSEGTIHVYSEPDKGTTFKIYLPRIDEVTPLTETNNGYEDAQLRGSETVLLVEDEQEVRELARKVLNKNGYSVLEADNGKQALRISNEYDRPIHMLLTDVVMPHMSGPDLARHLVLQHPETKILYMSGYTDKAIVQHNLLEPDTNFLQKPFTSDMLVRKIRMALDD